MTISLIINSHLNDAKIEASINPELATKRIQFVQKVLALYPDTNAKLDIEELDQIWNDLYKPQYKVKQSGNSTIITHNKVKNDR